MNKNLISKSKTAVVIIYSLIFVNCVGKNQNIRSVVRAIDGDTILLDHQEPVRLIGIDTSETVHPNKSVQYYGYEASNFTKNLIAGHKIILKFDHKVHDKYGRTLAYVFIKDSPICNTSKYSQYCNKGEVFLNEILIREGYALAYLKYPFNKYYKNQFIHFQDEAKRMKKGMWMNESCIGRGEECK